MPEEVLFKSESVQNRGEIATYLRQVADSLDAGGDITLRAGDQSLTMDIHPRASPSRSKPNEKARPASRVN